MIFDLSFTKSILFFINLVAYLDESNITHSHFTHKLNFFFFFASVCSIFVCLKDI